MPKIRRRNVPRALVAHLELGRRQRQFPPLTGPHWARRNLEAGATGDALMQSTATWADFAQSLFNAKEFIFLRQPRRSGSVNARKTRRYSRLNR